MKRATKVSIGLCFILTFIAACGEKLPKAPLEKTTLQLKWQHQSQFAGFYLAQEEGYYTAENLAVEFIEGGPGIDPAQVVGTGQADFGVVAPEDVLIKQSEGQDVTAIATIYQHSAVVFATLENSGIIRPKDFKGKTIAALGDGSMRDFELRLRVLLRKTGLDMTMIQLVPYDPDYKGFYDGKVDVTPAYLSGGVAKMRRKGCKLNLIWPDDYGIHFYSDVLIVSRKLLEEHSDRVVRFVRASLQGWRAAVSDPDKAVQVTMKYARIRNPDLQTDMMQALIPLVHTGEAQIGWMTAEAWQHMYDIMENQGLLSAPLPELTKVYSTRFLETIYGAKGQ